MLLLLLTNSCSTGSIEIKDERICAAQGLLSNGGICTHILSSIKEKISMDELLEIIEARPAIGETPAHGAGIILSAATFNEFETELETACRLLGKRCTEQMQNVINVMQSMIRKDN